MSRSEDEGKIASAAAKALQRWLSRARDVVMEPYRRWRMLPDPAAVYATQPDWNREVDTILATISQVALGAWSRASDVPPVSRHAFLVAYLADVQNLLVRIPDEVANLIFAEITDGLNTGESLDQVAARVDNVLSYTGSENWPHRARVIGITETTRAYGAGTTAAGLEQSRVTGRVLRKVWRTEHDDRVRPEHVAVDGQTRPVTMPFAVPWRGGTVSMMFPGDPSAPADLVVNCRCDVEIVNERGR